MTTEADKKTSAILRIISESDKPVGSKEISERLKDFGIDLTERAIRYHLKLIDEKGLTRMKWKEGRTLTKKGAEELLNARVFNKVGLVSSRIEKMAYLSDFDLKTKKGRVILNFSFFHKAEFKKALKIMKEVFLKDFGVGNLVFVAESGDDIDGIKVPTGRVAFGTLCAINFNSLLLKEGIPIESKFGGVLEVKDRKPFRFTELLGYSFSTVDPHEVFIRSRMTAVRDATHGSGKILAGMREIPAAAKEKAIEVFEKAALVGMGKPLFVGKEEEAVLGLPVGVERVGIVLPGGLNPIAATEEWGLETENRALVALIDYQKLISFTDLL